jgi:hypothetical protein
MNNIFIVVLWHMQTENADITRTFIAFLQSNLHTILNKNWNLRFNIKQMEVLIRDGKQGFIIRYSSTCL